MEIHGKAAIVHNVPLGSEYKIRAHISGESVEANARLIAAAPDLLEALKLAQRYMSGPRAPKYLQEPIKAADAAIANPTPQGADMRRRLCMRTTSKIPYRFRTPNVPQPSQDRQQTPQVHSWLALCCLPRGWKKPVRPYRTDWNGNEKS